jgi:hypothetical protein
MSEEVMTASYYIMSDVSVGMHVISVHHYSKTHYMHNWVDMMVAWASSKRDVLVVCFRIVNYWLQRQSDTIQCVQHCESKSRIQDCEAKLINAGVPLQNIGLLPTVGTCIIKQQMRDEAGIDHLLRSEHQVETPTTGHYSKTH